MLQSRNLQRYVDSFFDSLELYEDYKNNHNYKSILKASIDVFLENENEFNALEIYEVFFTLYQVTSDAESGQQYVRNESNIPLDFVKLMKKYGENGTNVINLQRCDFVHPVKVFLLGLAIYSQNGNYRRFFKEYVERSHHGNYHGAFDKRDKSSEVINEEFLFRWGIASLFHDAAIPIEFMGKPMKNVLNREINYMMASYGESLRFDFLDFEGLDSIPKIDHHFFMGYAYENPSANFLNLFKPTQIIFHNLSLNFDLEARKINLLENNLKDIIENVTLDHGLLSAVVVLKIYSYQIQRYQKDPSLFFYPVAGSATAIFLHNIYRNVLQRSPFDLGVLHPKQNPLAYLLILCDELQEMNRTPVGVKDNAGGPANDMEISIDDDAFYVKYILRTGSLNMKLYSGIGLFLKYILSIEDIFKRGLAVKTMFDLQDSVDIDGAPVQEISFRNIERIALGSYKKYAEEANDVREFRELPAQVKMDFIRQARTIPKKLNIVGCEIAVLSDKREAVTSFTPQEILDLAIFEHEQWCSEKFAQGWRYGEVRDDSKKIHNCLVPWEDLEPAMQQLDIDSSYNIIGLVDSIGFKIVLSKVRLLAIELCMHDQRKFGQSSDDFKSLPESVKQSHYKRAEVLVKSLGEIGYDVVDSDDYDHAIKQFDFSELEYLARREHDAWYMDKISSGWRYGDFKDDTAKLNPNLVVWENLNRDTQQFLIRSVEDLPHVCESVDLKIVKRDNHYSDV